MSFDVSPIQPAVLVTIIGEAVLQEQIIKLLDTLGATGYTLNPVKGFGSHGSRMGDIAGYNTNIEIKSIVSQELSDAILKSVREYQSNRGLIAFRQNIEAVY